MQYRISSNKITAGMFVANLDRPWIDTPFLLQGFLIENDGDIKQLQHYCKFVIVDSDLSTPNVRIVISTHGNNILENKADTVSSANGHSSDDGKLKIRPSFVPDHIPLTQFNNITSIEAELAPAENAYTQITEVLSDLIRNIGNNKYLAVQEVEAVMQIMVKTMTRNPDALMLISRLRQEDEDIYGHGISVAIYMVALGRHLGLPIDILERLGSVGLLHDIGSARLPHSLIHNKNKLTSAEFEAVKNHVPICIDILKKTPNLHPDILEGITQHHERENGSGYPDGISKDNIGLFGRIAAIADTFSALTNPRSYAEIYPPFEALHTLVDSGGELFHASIVEQFIQAIGIFPVGSMVELSSGEVAVVISHNKLRRLKPRVLIIGDQNKKPSQSPCTFDLMYQPATYETPISIVRGLPTGAYGLNPREYYLD